MLGRQTAGIASLLCRSRWSIRIRGHAGVRSAKSENLRKIKAGISRSEWAREA
jgi:hypothetical protein